MKKGALIIGIALVALIVHLFGVSLPADRVTFALDWIPTGKTTPFYAGAEKGFYKKVGIDVTVQRGYGSSDTIKRVATEGGPQFGLANTPAVIFGHNKGTRTTIIGIYADKGLGVVFTLSDSV